MSYDEEELEHRVFVVQNQLINGEPKFDFKDAAQWGGIVTLLDPSDNPFDMNIAVKRIHEAFTEYDFTDADHIIPVGNPCLIGAVVAIAAELNNGRVRFLQWNGSKRCYASIGALLYI